jgi:seryl-tRNA synthetase
MLDAKRLRNEIHRIAQELARRGFLLDVERITELEQQRKLWDVKTQQLQCERNLKSKHIGEAKIRQEETSDLLAEMGQFSRELKEVEEECEKIKKQLHTIYLMIPNIPDESVPSGKDEHDNVEIRRWGTPPQTDFVPKDHVSLGEHLGLFDFTVASKLSGSRFVVMRDDFARMQRALIQFMLAVHTKEHGYCEYYVPYLVKQECLLGTGQLPKFYDDQFWVSDESHLGLIPTAEVSLTNLVRDTILKAEQLPMKLVTHTPCFRREAGSYGKDTHGMMRQHQFEKIELVQIVKPQDSYQKLEELTSHAENILKKLKLPYRVVVLCTADLGFSAAKTYDLEVWMPGENCYREVSSCTNCEDFQARRLQARWRINPQEKPSFVHTLNGSGLAVGRTLIAIIENYQDEKGNIHIPEALWPYMAGQKIIQQSRTLNF